jgi:molybdenum cofactor biosynthesis enzyme MoaA
MEYALATNGSLAHKFTDTFKELSRLDLRISLDTLREDRFKKICGTNKYAVVVDNIRKLAHGRILRRVAMVVTNDNVDEVSEILDFCEELNINLKLFDMYSTPKSYAVWNTAYSPLHSAKKIVEERAVKIRQVSYTKNFGIPSLEYELKNGMVVRIKDSTGGTRYSKDFCSCCTNLPCQEGLYTILYSSDKKLIPCRLSPTQFDAKTPSDFRKNLRTLINIFRESYHENKFWRMKK